MTHLRCITTIGCNLFRTANPFTAIFLFIVLTSTATAQERFRFSGQLSSWFNVNSGTELPFRGGLRYIPQLNLSTPQSSKGLFDSELSVNLSGNAGMHPFDTLYASGNIRPYRVWLRYSTDQLEIRLGLQKLNFGSALMMRPLMWFDQTIPDYIFSKAALKQ